MPKENCVIYLFPIWTDLGTLCGARTKNANAQDRWRIIGKQRTCPLCLMDKHKVTDCPQRTNDARSEFCEHCEHTHCDTMDCYTQDQASTEITRPLNTQATLKEDTTPVSENEINSNPLPTTTSDDTSSPVSPEITTTFATSLCPTKSDDERDYWQRFGPL